MGASLHFGGYDAQHKQTKRGQKIAKPHIEVLLDGQSRNMADKDIEELGLQ